MVTKKRGPGRPRVNELGSYPLFTKIPPALKKKLDAIAAAERRSLSVAAAILLEEAVTARERKP